MTARGRLVGGPRAALALLLAIACAGCGLWHRATGPNWSDPAPPLALGAGIADHRSARRLLFVVFGDSGTGGPGQLDVAGRMVEECAKRGGCDFALMTGDNIYEAGVRPSHLADDGTPDFDPRFTRKFERAYAGFARMDFWAVPGNHDWYRPGSVDAEVAYTLASPRWRMPSHDYAVPGLPGWIRIYGLDTTKIRAGRESGQLERAHRALCGGAGWKLLVGHHPIYSSGPHAGPGGESAQLRERLVVPLIEPCGVHFYLSGHDHHQEHLQAPAFDQIIQGAGATLRRLRAPPRDRSVRTLVAKVRLGFALVEATPSRVELRFFGQASGGGWAAFHCRGFEHAGFADPASRSAPCAG